MLTALQLFNLGVALANAWYLLRLWPVYSDGLRTLILGGIFLCAESGFEGLQGLLDE